MATPGDNTTSMFVKHYCLTLPYIPTTTAFAARALARISPAQRFRNFLAPLQHKRLWVRSNMGVGLHTIPVPRIVPRPSTDYNRQVFWKFFREHQIVPFSECKEACARTRPHNIKPGVQVFLTEEVARYMDPEPCLIFTETRVPNHLILKLQQGASDCLPIHIPGRFYGGIHSIEFAGITDFGARELQPTSHPGR